VTTAASATSLGACPFCSGVEPTLSQRRESADRVVLGETIAGVQKDRRSFRVHRVFKGPNTADQIEAAAPGAKPGTLAILFGTESTAKNQTQGCEWSAVPANEAQLGYFAAAPDLRQLAPKRLAYFARYLGHPDAGIARDAYLEFAHAPFEDVLTVADQLDFAAFRRDLMNLSVPEERKGFLGVSLGMAATEKDRTENSRLLQRLIVEDGAEFRAGFDGILAGYLLLTGDRGLRLIDAQFLDKKDARHGDLRHAASALRFYWEYGPKELRGRIASATARLIRRPALAAAAITDLARWQSWGELNRIAALYEQEPYADGPTRRAIVGYLKSCPQRKAADELERLRNVDPTGVARAEKLLSLGT
jgi:hypothetical protein